jgi:hypothetical protein
MGPSGFAGGGSVTGGGQTTLGTYAMNEVGLRLARNGYTKTLTASTFVRGMPVVLGTATSTSPQAAAGAVWPNGFDIVLPGSQGATPINNLTIGLVWDFPDTTLARSGGWNPEDTGLIQCYGLNTKAVVSIGTVSMAAGLILTPDSGGTGIGAQLLTAVGPVTAAATGTAGHVELAGIGGLYVLAGAVASSSASGTVAASVFIRCL